MKKYYVLFPRRIDGVLYMVRDTMRAFTRDRAIDVANRERGAVVYELGKCQGMPEYVS